MAEINTANVGFEKELWDAAAMVGGIVVESIRKGV
ncbi:MAG: hypothetical protein UV57_C0030G0007 [Parcubacteria group bacterium GW2011_GWD2_43_10]|nr:MAG: hypothetical protein UV57_C0030G0007 [Parcubacteria group bacterium GW2011_GWD2_43_10]